ncbi:UNVERIFIED_CONTAM: pilT [Trichonephila clavipes]
MAYGISIAVDGSAAMDLPAMLKVLSTQDGSDLYLSTGAPPCAKFNGVLKALSQEPLKAGDVAAIADSVMDSAQREEFERELEMNLAISLAGVGRFRINIFKQRNEVSIVARNIKMEIPRFEDLKLPEVLLSTVMEKRGLVLFVGGTGSGKSTSLAALIDYRNRNSGGHIITIEDPVEYVHRHKKSIINQREVGVDTRSFHAALKNTLRQAPDRGLEALEVGGERRIGDAWPALDAAEHLGGAGHLRHPFGRDEAADFDIAQAGGAQVIDQAYLVGDADRLFLVLQAVARADFDQAHGVGQVHRFSSSVSGCNAWGGHRFSCPPRYGWVPLWWIDTA